MKTLILCTATIVLFIATQSSAVENRALYGFVDVMYIEPSNNSQWEFHDGKWPIYPKELAMKRIMGCAITSFVINGSGRTENIKMVSTIPAEGLARPVKKMLNQVKWQPVEEGSQPGEEQRITRFNFCMSEVSNEEARALCAKVSKLPCE